MKTTVLKMSVIATLAIFLLAGTSWADRGNKRHYKKVDKKHFRSGHHRSDGYHEPSHHGRGWYNHDRRHHKKYYDRHWAAHRAERHAFKRHHKLHKRVYRNRHHHYYQHHDHYRHKVIRKHYHKHKPSHNLFSYKASIFDPGWSITFKTKSRW